jgi:hypothetical protein
MLIEDRNRPRKPRKRENARIYFIEIRILGEEINEIDKRK